MAQERRRTGSDPPQDDLFGKLDNLMSRQARPARKRAEPQVPTLTEAVAATPQQLEIPVLNEVVDTPPTPPEPNRAASPLDPSAPLVDKRKQLQVALYLRLRQRLDQELQAALAAHATLSDPVLNQLARELRNALPAIVREAVDQVFAPETGPAAPRPGGEGSKL